MSEKASTSSSSERLSDGWIGSEGDDETPVPKKKRLSLSLKKRSKLESDSAHLPCATSEKENVPRSRWSFLSEVEELGLAKKCVPKNTATMTKWALSCLADQPKSKRGRAISLSLNFVSTSKQVVSSNAQSHEYSHLVKMCCTRAHPWLRLLPACPQLL